jgi:hypothetical protein
VFARINAALSRHGAQLAAARLDGKKPVAIWAVLKPDSAVRPKAKHPRDDQDCVCVNFLVIGWIPEHPRGAVMEGLGRCLERSREGNLTEIIFATHRQLLNICDRQMRARFRLRVGEHVWVGEMHGGQDENHIFGLHVLIRTYFDFDMLSAQQEAGAIMPSLKTGGYRLGDAWLLPIPFRRLDIDDDGTVSITVAEDVPCLASNMKGGDSSQLREISVICQAKGT